MPTFRDNFMGYGCNSGIITGGCKTAKEGLTKPKTLQIASLKLGWMLTKTHGRVTGFSGPKPRVKKRGSKRVPLASLLDYTKRC